MFEGKKQKYLEIQFQKMPTAVQFSTFDFFVFSDKLTFYQIFQFS